MKATLTTQEEGIRAIAEIRKEILENFIDTSNVDPEIVGMWTLIEYYKRTTPGDKISYEQFLEFYKLVLDESHGGGRVFRSFKKAVDYFFNKFINTLTPGKEKNRLNKLKYNYKNQKGSNAKKERRFNEKNMLQEMLDKGFKVEFKIIAPPIEDSQTTNQSTD